MNEARQGLIGEIETDLRHTLANRLADPDTMAEDLRVILLDPEQTLATLFVAWIGILDDPALIEIIYRNSVRDGFGSSLHAPDSHPIRSQLARLLPGFDNVTAAFLVASLRGLDRFGNTSFVPGAVSQPPRRWLYWGLAAALAHGLSGTLPAVLNDLPELIEHTPRPVCRHSTTVLPIHRPRRSPARSGRRT